MGGLRKEFDDANFPRRIRGLAISIGFLIS
jgi:hypothetical protein